MHFHRQRRILGHKSRSDRRSWPSQYYTYQHSYHLGQRLCIKLCSYSRLQIQSRLQCSILDTGCRRFPILVYTSREGSQYIYWMIYHNIYLLHTAHSAYYHWKVEFHPNIDLRTHHCNQSNWGTIHRIIALNMIQLSQLWYCLDISEVMYQLILFLYSVMAYNMILEHQYKHRLSGINLYYILNMF